MRRRAPSTGTPRKQAPAPRRRGPARAVASRPGSGTRQVPRLTRRALLAVAAALALVVAVMTGLLPRALRSLVGDAGAPAAASAPAGAASLRAVGLSAPSLDGADLVQTRASSVTISGAVPAELAGLAGYKVRLYVAVGSGAAQPVQDVAIGSTSLFTVRNVRLQPGRNSFTATIAGPDGEGTPSVARTYVLDTSKPKISLTAPTDGATVNRSTAEVQGKTQAGSTVSARNAANGATATTIADTKGLFTLEIAIDVGSNAVTLTATDPAGNAGTASLAIVGGVGRLRVLLEASSTHISASRLPTDLILTATALDPDGAPLQDITVAFTLTLTGLPPFSGDRATDSNGRATFRVPLPAGTATGSGGATAQISTGPYGDATKQITLDVVP